jgi:predicted nucleic acid-binding Zn ribbon protein
VERAGSALGPLIKDLGLEDALRLYRIKQSWKDILGEPLAMHAAPTALKGGVLHINISTPAWLQQAGYYKAQILEKLGRLGVADIRLKLGKIQFSSPPKAKERLSYKEPDTALIEELLSSIEDDEVKEAVRRAARKALGTPPRQSR